MGDTFNSVGGHNLVEPDTSRCNYLRTKLLYMSRLSWRIGNIYAKILMIYIINY